MGHLKRPRLTLDEQWIAARRRATEGQLRFTGQRARRVERGVVIAAEDGAYDVQVPGRAEPWSGLRSCVGEHEVHDEVLVGFLQVGHQQTDWLPMIIGSIGAGSVPATADFDLAVYDWVQSLMNPYLSGSHRATCSPPDTGHLSLAILSGDAQVQGGLLRPLGAVSLGDCWVYVAYVANAGLTGYDKIRITAREWTSHVTRWTYDIAISTITNATNTSIPTTANLFWDAALGVLHIIDFNFYSCKIPSSANPPTEVQTRTGAARRYAGYAEGGLLHHTGTGITLYRYSLSSGWSTAGTLNLFAASIWGGTQWTRSVTITQALLDQYRAFNRPWAYVNGRWYAVIAASCSDSAHPDYGQSQIRLFTVDNTTGAITHTKLWQWNWQTMERIALPEVTAAYADYMASFYPSPAVHPGPSAAYPLQRVFVGGLSGPGTTYITNYSLQAVFEGPVTGVNITGTHTYEGPGPGELHTGNPGPLLMCPRPQSAVYRASFPAFEALRSLRLDLPAAAINTLSTANSLYPGVVVDHSGQLVISWIEPVCYLHGTGNSSGRYTLAVTPTIGHEPGDPTFAVTETVGLVETPTFGARTMLGWVDPVQSRIVERVEISPRAVLQGEITGVAPIAVTMQTPTPWACQVWGLATVLSGQHRGALIVLQDWPDHSQPSRDPQLRLQIFNRDRQLVWQSPVFGPPQSQVSGHSNTWYNGRNAYQYCAFQTNSAYAARVPNVGWPQVRVILPEDGSPPWMIVGLWSERITDGTDPASYDNDHWRTDLWVYSLADLAAPVLVRHFTESAKVQTDVWLPKGADFGRMLVGGGQLFFVSGSNGAWRILQLN